FAIVQSVFFFFSSRRRHTRFSRDWSSDVCSSDLLRHRNRTEADLFALRDLEGPNPARVVNESRPFVQLPAVFIHCPLIESDQNVQSVSMISRLPGRDANLVVGVSSFDQGHEVTIRKDVMSPPVQRHGENLAGAVDSLPLGAAHFPSQFCHGLFHLPPTLIYNRPPLFGGHRFQPLPAKLSIAN